MSEHDDRGVVQLVDAGVPADQGLSTLGLLMQLAGNVLAPFGALLMLQQLVLQSVVGGSRVTLLLVLAMSVGRSLLHRAAGTQLVYGKPESEGPTDRFGGIWRYSLFSIGQSVLLAALFADNLPGHGRGAIFVAAALLIWPVTLLVLTRLPRFARFRHTLPLSEDKGFESTAVLMTVLGLCGLLAVGSVLVILLDLASSMHGAEVLFLLALSMLVIRSALHVRAGFSGLRETSVDRAVELANRYANFGVISSFCTGGALLMFVMYGTANVFMLGSICCITWMLMAWPLAVRRFYSERQFADIMAGDAAPVHRRAPDAGLTGLGWLLFAHAMLSASSVVIAMGGDEGGGVLGGMLALGSLGVRSLWFPAGVVVLQAWAGFELIRMSPQSRGIASVFGVVGLAVAVYTNWPVLQTLRALDLYEYSSLGPIAIALVLPGVTLLLVHRVIAPTARARFRRKTA